MESMPACSYPPSPLRVVCRADAEVRTAACCAPASSVIGGLVDLYFFLGPSPEAVLRQYHAVIGKTALPPYWALGAVQSKWGYENLGVVEQAR